MESVNAALIVGSATIFAALLGLIGVLLGIMHKTAKRTAAKTDVLSEKADVIVDNVQNSHKVGFRDDFDAQITGLARLVTSHHTGLSGELQQIRVELASDREESRSDMKAINRRVDETVGRIYRLEQKKED